MGGRAGPAAGVPRKQGKRSAGWDAGPACHAGAVIGLQKGQMP
ncbi:hypothetical protein [Paenibacillus gansuensis]|uniref:Uncharacterized protein n=1 Tax=Paenibacillus gansuensis TaxID=306542 RepID=A0ABW5PFR7_9BACL